jgi:hypothetical protein
VALRLDDLTKPQKGGQKIIDRIPHAPWDNEFVYATTGDGYLITSYGSDGQPGGDGAAQDLTTDNIDQIVK